MLTRRAFLTGLTATTALVAVPGAYAATVNYDKIMALLERKIREAQEPLAKELWADDTRVKGGLTDLLVDEPELPPYSAYEETAKQTYQWTTYAGSITVKA